MNEFEIMRKNQKAKEAVIKKANHLVSLFLWRIPESNR